MSLLDRIKDAIDDKQRWRKTAHRSEIREEDLLHAIKGCRRSLQRKRGRKRTVEERYPSETEVEWNARREKLADEIEELEFELDRLIEKLDARERKTANAYRELREEDRRVKRLRRKRERIREEKKGQLSKDFHVAEFDCRDGTPVPQSAIPALKALCRDHLQPLRDSGGTVSITSGYRTRAYNASIGGASMSYHIYDERPQAPAVDHVQSGRSAPDVQKWHDSEGNPDGMGYYAGFTHIDERGYRSRWFGAG